MASLRKSFAGASRACLAVAVVASSWAAGAMPTPDPLDPLGGWLRNHWSQAVLTLTAALIVYYVRKIDAKFEVLFRWKDAVDKVVGVHEEVWSHEGCGPLWVHHRADGQSALHFRAADHPGLCDRCRGLSGKVIDP